MHWVIKMLQLATRPTDTDHQISDFHGKLKFFVLDMVIKMVATIEDPLWLLWLKLPRERKHGSSQWAFKLAKNSNWQKKWFKGNRILFKLLTYFEWGEFHCNHIIISHLKLQLHWWHWEFPTKSTLSVTTFPARNLSLKLSQSQTWDFQVCQCDIHRLVLMIRWQLWMALEIQTTEKS